MGGGSGGGGKSGRGGGGGGGPEKVDVSQRSTSSQNAVSGGFAIGDDVKIETVDVSWKDKRTHSALKDAGFEFNGRSKTWSKEIPNVQSKDEVKSVIDKVSRRATLKVSSYHFNPGVDSVRDHGPY